MVGEIVLFGLWLVAGWAFNRHAKRTDIEIAKLRRENASCAKAIAAQSQAIAKQGDAIAAQSDSVAEVLKLAQSCQAAMLTGFVASGLAEIADHAALLADLEKRLTAVEVAPKSSEGKSRTRTVPFRAWRAAAETLEAASIRTAAEVSKEE